MPSPRQSNRVAPARPREPKKGHAWRETGRTPVELVRHVCDCGCAQQRVSIINPGDGRGVAFKIPKLAPTSVAALDQVDRGIQFGRDLFAFWQRVKGLRG
jgi:hypothetical protein